MVTLDSLRGLRPGRVVAGLSCAVSLLALAGCGGPKVVKMTGKVYNRDKPYPGVTVCLFPDSPGTRPAESMAGPDGSFEFKTLDPDGGVLHGVVPGRYKVGIRPQIRGGIPAFTKYTSAKSSPLTVDVPPEGLTDYEVKLK
jgi:hypothetical protein